MIYGNAKHSAGHSADGLEQGTDAEFGDMMPAGKLAPGAAALTRNQSIILDALKEAKRPLKAYDLLEVVKEKGVRAPMTVYRALADLMKKGLVCKLTSTKAYAARLADDCTFPVFLVCENCGSSQVITDPAMEQAARTLVGESGYSADRLRIEVTSRCCGN